MEGWMQIALFSALFVATLARNVGVRKRHVFAVDPEEHMDAYQLITTKGYKCEEYEVETEDGYRITIQRIPHGIGMDDKVKRPVVFLQHGLLCSSTNWITNLRNQSFAFILADAGFDVWLGNVRGNTYGRSHATMNTDNPKFWEFSWDEMAKYDLSATIDQALDVSGQPNLYYVGHSQGSLTMFAKLSTDSHFAGKIKQFHAVGPVVTVGHASGIGALAAPLTDDLQRVLNLFGLHEFLPSDWLIRFLGRTVCGSQLTNPLCANVLFLVAGWDSAQLNRTRLPVYLGHTPAGTSTRNIVHFGQMINSGDFAAYDFGSAKENYRHYGIPVPFKYDVKRVNVPVALWWGENDILADPTDVRHIIPKLPNLLGSFGLKDFNHLDFIWGMKAADMCYKPIIKMIKDDLAT